MKKIETFDSGRWKAFFRCSNELCKAWFPYKVIETFYDKTLIQGTCNGHEMQGADNMIGMLQHGFGHLSLNGFVELVDLLVTKNDFARQIRLAIDKGV